MIPSDCNNVVSFGPTPLSNPRLSGTATATVFGFAAAFGAATFAVASVAIGLAGFVADVVRAALIVGAALVAAAFNGACALAGAVLDAGFGSSINGAAVTFAFATGFSTGDGGVAATGGASTVLGDVTSLGSVSLFETEFSETSHHARAPEISTAVIISGK